MLKACKYLVQTALQTVTNLNKLHVISSLACHSLHRRFSITDYKHRATYVGLYTINMLCKSLAMRSMGRYSMFSFNIQFLTYKFCLGFKQVAQDSLSIGVRPLGMDRPSLASLLCASMHGLENKYWCNHR